MANAILNWTLPNKRTSGFPFPPEEVKHVRVEMSADGGSNWAIIGLYPANVLTTTVTELEPGTWNFRGIVVDTSDKQSAVKAATLVIPDLSPPESLQTFTVSLG